MNGSIVIVGLGPGDPNLLTLKAHRRLTAAREVYLRTRRHPTVAALPDGLRIHSFDALYESLPTFDAVYDAIAAEVVRLGQRPEGVVYAVPGHPLVGEATTQRILALAADAGLAVEIVEGLSFIEPVLSALGLDPLDGLQIADAVIVAAQHHPRLSADRPALLSQLYSRDIASEVKLTLMNLYPDEHPVTLVRAAGTADVTVRTLPLFELDRQPDLDHLTSLYLPPLEEPWPTRHCKTWWPTSAPPTAAPGTVSRRTPACAVGCWKKPTRCWRPSMPATPPNCGRNWATCCCKWRCKLGSPSKRASSCPATSSAAS